MNQNVIKNTAYNYLHGYRLSMTYLEEIQQLVAEGKKQDITYINGYASWRPTAG